MGIVNTQYVMSRHHDKPHPHVHIAYNRVFNIEKTFYPDTAALIRAIQRGELRLENEIILIKGASKFGFDSLTEVLEKKVHETIPVSYTHLDVYKRQAKSGGD